MSDTTPTAPTLIDIDPTSDAGCAVCRRTCTDGCGVLVLPAAAGRVWFCERLCLDLWVGGLRHGAVQLPGAGSRRRRKRAS